MLGFPISLQTASSSLAVSCLLLLAQQWAKRSGGSATRFLGDAGRFFYKQASNLSLQSVATDGAAVNPFWILDFGLKN